MSDLILDGDVIERMRSDLGRLRREFDDANENSDAVAVAVGHSHLADKVRNFAHNWDQRRKDLVEQITTIEDNMAEISMQFATLDGDLATDLNGRS